MIVTVEKKYRKVDLDPTKWTQTKNADGSYTYTATATATVRFIEDPNGDIQTHDNVAAGKKFTTNGGVANVWGLYN